MIISEFPQPADDIDHTKTPKVDPELQAHAEQTAAAIYRALQEESGFMDLDWLETGHADG